MTLDCIKSIKETYPDAGISIVDNASRDNTVYAVRKAYPEVDIIENSENFGYAKAVNIGVRSSTEENLIVSNTDVIFYPESINRLLDSINSGIALAGPNQKYKNGKNQFSTGFIPGIKLILINMMLIYPILNRIAFKLKLTFDYVDGAVLAFKRKVFDEVGGFDENFTFYSEDADFSKKITDKGYKIRVNYDAKVIHLRGASTNTNGVNTEILKLFTDGKIKLSKKYNSDVITRIYMVSEYFFCLVFKSIFKMQNLLFGKDTISKYITQRELQRIWKNRIVNSRVRNKK